MLSILLFETWASGILVQTLVAKSNLGSIILVRVKNCFRTLRNDVDASGNYYKNPLYMRNAKYRAWLHLGRRVQCVKYIRFESVIHNLTKFADEFRIRLYPNHARRQSPTKKSQMNSVTMYPNLTIQEIRAINSRLDVDLERRFGYSLDRA